MGLSSAVSLAAGGGFPREAGASVSAGQAALLKSTLTPMGSLRAGNAEGTIPAWTGGLTEIPPGWTPDQTMPDPFADEKPLFQITPQNVAKYRDKLSDGTIAMITIYGMNLNVFQTRRTHALPQWVYDNIVLNAANTQPDAGGSRLGFSGAYGGYPFPIPDASDPFEAGAQIIWNHRAKWLGEHLIADFAPYSMAGNAGVLLTAGKDYYLFPYYQKDGNVSTFDGFGYKIYLEGYAPAGNAGSEFIGWSSFNPLVRATQSWTYLAGQGRVRKVPQLEYDTPESQNNGLTNYDEDYLFDGSMDRYDWKLIGRREIYIPYNNGAVFELTAQDMLPNYLDPDKIRWELHRVWVVDATLHPGQHHVVPHRRMYVDEDTWSIGVADEWDANGALWKLGQNFLFNRPDLPGAVIGATVNYNIQQRGYVIAGLVDFSKPVSDRVLDFQTVPAAKLYNPQTMAETAQY